MTRQDSPEVIDAAEPRIIPARASNRETRVGMMDSMGECCRAQLAPSWSGRTGGSRNGGAAGRGGR